MTLGITSAGVTGNSYLAGPAKQQTGHGLLDVSMAKDVGSHLGKDALMQVWLCSICLECRLFLHSTCTLSTRSEAEPAFDGL